MLELHGEFDYESIVIVCDRNHGYEEAWSYGNGFNDSLYIFRFGIA